MGDNNMSPNDEVGVFVEQRKLVCYTVKAGSINAKHLDCRNLLWRI